jgi:hypothetical protein
LLDTVSALIGLSLGTRSPSLPVPTPAAPPAVVFVAPQGVLEARKGTRFVVDIKNNMGHLMHVDGSVASFRVATGREEWVNYLDKYYFAQTPVMKSTVTQIETQPDSPSNRVTYSEDLKFLRIRGHYGIHHYLYLDDILEKDIEGRYFSMGCVLVTLEVLDVLEKIYELNGGMLEVETVYGLQTAMVAQKS